MAPGDVIVYHGLIYGERGPCLVIGLWMPRYPEGDGWRQIAYISNGRLCQHAICLNNEDMQWSRISDQL